MKCQKYFSSKSAVLGSIVASILLSSRVPTVMAFLVKPNIFSHSALSSGTRSSILCSSSKDDSSAHESVDSDKNLLNLRLQRMRRELLEQELQSIPNPEFGPEGFVLEVLKGLLDPDDPLPDSGFRHLLRASTAEWRRSVCKSIGAPDDAPEDFVASALGTALGRPNNQFGILVHAEDAEDYAISFPSEPLDYGDGTCWLECRLRGTQDNELLVAMGWQLQQRSSDGAWLIDGLDWQDFRDQYRPGIGREEWERICG